MLLLRPVFRTGGLFCAAILTPKSTADNTILPQSLHPPEIEDSRPKGWDSVRKIFTINEFSEISPEMNTIMQSTFFSAFFGACYGGFVQSREAYLQFIERNQATQFVDHFEAKKKLQDHVTLNFAKGALRWGWRLSLFAGLYVTFVTTLAAYRGRPSLVDYIIGGVFSGGIYQMHVGLRGLIVGSTLGAMMGLFAGSLSMSVMRLTGTSMDEVHQYRYELSQKRQRHFDEALEKSENIDTTLLKNHDDLLNKNKH